MVNHQETNKLQQEVLIYKSKLQTKIPISKPRIPITSRHRLPIIMWGTPPSVPQLQVGEDLVWQIQVGPPRDYLTRQGPRAHQSNNNNITAIEIQKKVMNLHTMTNFIKVQMLLQLDIRTLLIIQIIKLQSKIVTLVWIQVHNK